MDNALALANTLDEIEQLERKFVNEPDVETASKLAATRHVANMLGMKVEQDKTLRIEQQNLEKRAGFERRYSEVNHRLDVLYTEAEAGLKQALDATDEAVNLYHESRQLASFIDKMGGYVPRVEQSFWSRSPHLRDRFHNSILRNGEP